MDSVNVDLREKGLFGENKNHIEVGKGAEDDKEEGDAVLVMSSCLAHAAQTVVALGPTLFSDIGDVAVQCILACVHVGRGAVT